jgi:hypothetical protein
MMYKMKTPPWREMYRTRCMERLRNGRDRLISRFRQLDLQSTGPEGDGDIISDVMKEEWSVMRGTVLSGLRHDPFLSEHDVSLPDDDDGDDEIISIMEAIKLELQNEEQLILEAYRAGEMFEQSNLDASIDLTDPNSVVCPICTRNRLLQNKNVIFCACGLRLDMEQDGLMLSNLKEQLDVGVMSHEQMACQGRAQFFTCNEGGITSLMMSCQTCDFLFVVV